MYRHLIRPLLLGINPETAKNCSLALLHFVNRLPFAETFGKLLHKKDLKCTKEVLGLNFSSAVGIGAGIDANAEYVNDLASLGVGFVEIGSITPKAQNGTQKPRIFCISKDKALINRIGCENKGVHYVIDMLRKEKPKTIVAANLTQQSNSVQEDISKDFEKTFSLLYDFVDMFILNIPNPCIGSMSDLIDNISEVCDSLLDLRLYYDEYRPILVKLSVDIPRVKVDEVLDYCMRSGIDGIVVSGESDNMDGLTLDQEQLDSIGCGRLSGAPVYARTLAMVKYVHEKSAHSLQIVASGGIMTAEQAQEMLDCGASLIQLCTAFVYEGGSVVKNIIKTLKKNNNKK